MINKKSLGQNWLNNREILNYIASLAAGLYETDDISGTVSIRDNQSAGQSSEKQGLCVEIGPGLGYLTSSLFKRFDKVVAVEYDADLARKLPGSFPGKNLEVVNEDILQYDFDKISEPYVVAGNIPYYITSPIIRKVLLLNRNPERVVLLVQKEVAERIVSDKETVLSLFVNNHAKVMAGMVVDKSEFTPPPKVDSAVIVMEPYAKPLVPEEVFGLIEQGFRMPRKKLIHNLAGLKSREELVQLLDGCGISSDARPGDVGLSQWGELYQNLPQFNG